MGGGGGCGGEKGGQDDDLSVLFRRERNGEHVFVFFCGGGTEAGEPLHQLTSGVARLV